MDKKYGDWRDLPEKNEEQCEFCGRFFLDVNKHKNKVHGKGQSKLFVNEQKNEVNNG